MTRIATLLAVTAGLFWWPPPTPARGATTVSPWIEFSPSCNPKFPVSCVEDR